MAKKLGKFLLVTAAVGTAAFAAYHFMQKKNADSSDFDENDEDFDDFSDDFDEESDVSRNYVPLTNIPPEDLNTDDVDDVMEDLEELLESENILEAEALPISEEAMDTETDSDAEDIVDAENLLNSEDIVNAEELFDSEDIVDAEELLNSDVFTDADNTGINMADMLASDLESEENFTPLAEQVAQKSDEDLEKTIEEFFDDEDTDDEEISLLND